MSLYKVGFLFHSIGIVLSILGLFQSQSLGFSHIYMGFLCALLSKPFLD